MKHPNSRHPLIAPLVAVCCWLQTPPLWAAVEKSAVTQSASALYENALKLNNTHDPVAAVIELKNSLQIDPNSASAQLLIGQIYLEQGLGAAAEEALRSALRLGADRNEVVPLLAKSLVRQGREAELLKDISAEGLTGEHAAEVHSLRALAFLSRRQKLLANEELAQALVLTPQGLTANLVKMTLLLQSNELAQAETLATAVVMEHPNEPEAWLAASSAAVLRGDDAAALAGYARALELQPRHLTARLSRIAVLLDLKRDEEAQVDFDYLTKEFSKDPRASYLRAVWLARRKGSGPQITAALQSVIASVKELNEKAFAEDPMLNLMTGLSWYGLGQFQQARTHLETYVQQSPRDLGATKVLADILIRVGEAARAATLLEPVVSATPQDPRAVSLLASAYALSNRTKQANALLETSIALGGENTRLRPKLARLQLSGGDFTRGLPALASVFDEDPNDQDLGVALVAAYLNQGNTKQAIAVAERLNKAKPNQPVYSNLLGVAWYVAGDNPRARAAFEATIAQTPAFVPARINLAKLALKEGHLAEARTLLTTLQTQQPQSAKVALELSRVEYADGNVRAGLKLAEDALRLAPSDHAMLINLIDLRLSANELDTALDLILKAEVDYPDDVEIISRHARFALLKKDHDTARSLFRKQADLSGTHNDILLQTAALQAANGFLDDADYTLSKLLGNAPTDQLALVAHTKVALQRRDYATALGRAQTLLAAYPQSPNSHALHGEANLGLKRWDAALVDFDQARALGPSQLVVVRAYHALRGAGQASQARARLQNWLVDHPQDLLVKTALAEDFLAAGELAAAETQYTALHEANPKDPSPLNNLANIRLALGQPGALDAARLALTLAPQNPLVIDTLGWILVKTGKPEEALPVLREANTRASDNPEIHYHLAVCLQTLGRNDEARKELTQALQGDQPFEGREDAKKRQLALAAKAPAQP